MQATFQLGERMELMKRMGATVDADIFTALSDRRLGGLELHDMVERCAACRHASACAAWLDTHPDTAPGEAPEYCLNRELLRRLAA
jgi:hypothetical protein